MDMAVLISFGVNAVCAGGAEKTPGSVKAKPNHQTVIDTASNITTVPPPHTINQFYPPSGQYQRTAVVTQVT